MKEAPWGKISRAMEIPDDLRTSCLEPKSQTGKTIGIHGSPSLVRSLMRGGFFDRLHLFLVPLIAGKDARLFEGDVPPQVLKAVDLIQNESGILAITYRPSGPP